MDIVKLEKLREEEVDIEKHMEALREDREDIDDEIDKLNSLLHKVHDEANDIVFGTNDVKQV